MLRSAAPRKSKLAVLYLRSGPDVDEKLKPSEQELMCRNYCDMNSIQISHTVHVDCGPEESLAVMQYLLRTMPPEVDTLMAATFFSFSTLLPQLAQLCLIFQCRPTCVQCLDVVGPLYRAIHAIEAKDYLLAEQRYQELIR